MKQTALLNLLGQSPWQDNITRRMLDDGSLGRTIDALGITGLTSSDGRVTIMMPHPERTPRALNMSWAPAEWQGDSPWMRMFRNARVWCG